MVDCLNRDSEKAKEYIVEDPNGVRLRYNRDFIVLNFPNQALDYFEKMIEHDIENGNPQ